eukprot:INCI12899.1.p1 GENE.INCI12899.1~~INCI12899.1.p1  ORF type:complete len:515 (+),score=76.06 INCI12899.1:316-1860(+)
MSRTGFVFEELYLWHEGAMPHRGSAPIQPCVAYENPDTKRRFHSLLKYSGIIDRLEPIRARYATPEEICRFHTREYHDRIHEESRFRGGDGGHVAHFAEGGYDIAALSAGGVVAAVEAMMKASEERRIRNAYCLVRPPGHHATATMGMGYCIFNNIVIAARHAQELHRDGVGGIARKGNLRIAVVDYDVHHGNGTQGAFESDPDCLFISIHQAGNYPPHSGGVAELGSRQGFYSVPSESSVAAEDNAGGGGTAKSPEQFPGIVNVPLPPGCGSGAYKYAFDNIVVPSLRRFQPDMIFVSSGFDANYLDPLARMMLCSDDYRYMARQLLEEAEVLCNGRIIFAHEGGYSADYVPFCGVAVVEECVRTSAAHMTTPDLPGPVETDESSHTSNEHIHYHRGYRLNKGVFGVLKDQEDPFLGEVLNWGGQDLQSHQRQLIDSVCRLHKLPVEDAAQDASPLEGQTLHPSVLDTVMQAENRMLEDGVLALVRTMSNKCRAFEYLQEFIRKTTAVPGESD